MCLVVIRPSPLITVVRQIHFRIPNRAPLQYVAQPPRTYGLLGSKKLRTHCLWKRRNFICRVDALMKLAQQLDWNNPAQFVLYCTWDQMAFAFLLRGCCPLSTRPTPSPPVPQSDPTTAAAITTIPNPPNAHPLTKHPPSPAHGSDFLWIVGKKQ